MQGFRPSYVIAAALALLTTSVAEAIRPAGEKCQNAPPPVSINFVDGDNNAGRADDYDPPADNTCPSTGGGIMSLASGEGPDVVYPIRPAKSGTIQATLEPDPGIDLALYVVSADCPFVVLDTNCVVGDDSNGGGVQEQVSFTGTAGTTYYLVVDSWFNQAGQYRLTVTGLLSPLDIDGDGEVDPLTDGLLTLRWQFGFRGDTLLGGAVDLVNCTRCDADDIEFYLETIEARL